MAPPLRSTKKKGTSTPSLKVPASKRTKLEDSAVTAKRSLKFLDYHLLYLTRQFS